MSTPRSFSGLIHSAKIGRTAALLCIQMPRILPVPLSMLKYAEWSACSGFGSLAVPRCFSAYSREPIRPCSSAPQSAMRIVRRGLRPDGLEDAQHFHHRRHAGGVVGGAGRAVPRVEVRADEHDLLRRVGAREVADDVEAVQLRSAVARRESACDVELDLHRHVVLEQAHHAVVVLDGERDLRQDRHR